MNKKIAELLRAHKLYNDWDLTNDGHPMIHVHRPSGYRDVSGHAVVLSIKGRKFKDTPWYQNGDKWFGYLGKDGQQVELENALAWVAKRFPDLKMVKSPFYKDAWIVEADLNERLKEIENEKGIQSVVAE